MFLKRQIICQFYLGSNYQEGAETYGNKENRKSITAA